MTSPLQRATDNINDPDKFIIEEVAGGTIRVKPKLDAETQTMLDEIDSKPSPVDNMTSEQINFGFDFIMTLMSCDFDNDKHFKYLQENMEEPLTREEYNSFRSTLII